MHSTRIIVVAFLISLTAAVGFAASKPVAEWTFDRPGDLQGWQPNAHLTNVVVTNGALSCRAVGVDPILEFRPPLDFPAAPLQAVELRLKADRDGTAEWFWSNTSTGRYGGFTQEKTTRFSVRGDRQWHTYRLMPCWQGERRIVRLRLDYYDAARFDLGQIRIVDLGSDIADKRQQFDFDQEDGKWQWFEPAGDTRDIPVVTDGRVARCGAGLLLGPRVQIDAAKNTFVSIRFAVDRGEQGRIFYATDKRSGLHSRSFRLERDGGEHTYNLDMLETSEWEGTILALGLLPSDDTNAAAKLVRLGVSDEPEGPARLQVISFALEEALARADRPTTLAAIISNTGGETASNAAAVLEVPRSLDLRSTSPAEQQIARLGFGEKAVVRWTVQAAAPLEGQVRLRLAAGNASATVASASVRFTARLSVPPRGYVPEPKPVRGPFEVGVYYFPGWRTASQWQPLAGFPERKPVLGWYREGEPEVADWHIKWAVEHGITFFAYDWYWSKGTRQLEHALHDGFFKARYRHLLKFCLLWANHNPPQSSSHEDCLAVTRYWIDNYFQRPEHLCFDGKPAIIIFSPHRLTTDLGSEGVKQAFAAMREECKRAGLRGLHIIACVGDAGGARRAAEEGYDSVTAYNWPGLGLTGESKQGPFATVVEGYRRQWEHLLQEGRLPLSPVPVSGGWDSRPWHGENNLVRFGRTPELFKQHLLDARQILESAAYKSITPKALLIEAWNEWGEGSYIEPHAEYGFGFLDAVRDALTSAPAVHEDVTPADAGLGPYDAPPPPPSRTDWTFDDPGAAWDNTMDLAEVKVADGVLLARTTGNDPAFFGPQTQARAADYAAVMLRMRVSPSQAGAPEDVGQLFWRTSRQAENESTSEKFRVHVDGQWHDYRVPVAQNPRWRGIITRLRLDPGNRSGMKIELDHIWLAR